MSNSSIVSDGANGLKKIWERLYRLVAVDRSPDMADYHLVDPQGSRLMTRQEFLYFLGVATLALSTRTGRRAALAATFLALSNGQTRPLILLTAALAAAACSSPPTSTPPPTSNPTETVLSREELFELAGVGYEKAYFDRVASTRERLFNLYVADIGYRNLYRAQTGASVDPIFTPFTNEINVAINDLNLLSEEGEQLNYIRDRLDLSGVYMNAMEYANNPYIIIARLLADISPAGPILDGIDIGSYFLRRKDALGYPMNFFDLGLAALGILQLDDLVQIPASIRKVLTRTRLVRYYTETGDEVVYVVSKTGKIKRILVDAAEVVDDIGIDEFKDAVSRAYGQGNRIVLDVGTGGRIANWGSITSAYDAKHVVLATDSDAGIFDVFFREGRDAASVGRLERGNVAYINENLSRLKGILGDVDVIRTAFPYNSGLGFFLDLANTSELVGKGKKIQGLINGDSVADLLIHQGLATDDLYRYAYGKLKTVANNFTGLEQYVNVAEDSMDEIRRTVRRFLHGNIGFSYGGKRFRNTDMYIYFRHLLMEDLSEYFGALSSGTAVSARSLGYEEISRLGTQWAYRCLDSLDTVVFLDIFK